jgi:hypothetical protein
LRRQGVVGAAHGSARVLGRAVRGRARAAQVSLRPPRVSPEEVRAALGGVSAEAALRGAVLRALPTVAAFEARLDALDEQDRVALLGRADASVAHRFDLLGSGPVDLGPEVDWHADFKTGRRWPARHISRLPISYPDGSDVKVPWELSRGQHLPQLAAAARLTGGARYADELHAQLHHWIERNAVEIGPNWLCTMDVAVRATNWVAALALWPAAADERVLASLLLHGRFIRTHLEWTPVRGNHYLADVAGLLVIAALFSGGEEGRAWARWAAAELPREMEHQVLADGCAHEASLPYHRLVAELMLCATQAADALLPGTLPEWHRERLQRMLDVVAVVRRPDGLVPQVGDADDGRFLPLDDYGVADPRSHDHLFAQAGRPVPGAPRPALSDAGLWVLRDGPLWVLVRCGPTGMRGRGGHGHNDALSFELSVGDRPVVVDPGSYLYTADPAARNAFRSTAAHSTLRVDGREQNDLGLDLFLLPERARARALQVDERRFEGRHEGFGAGHVRTLTLEGGELLRVVDTIDDDHEHLLEYALPLDPGCTAQVHEGEVVVRSGEWRIEVAAPGMPLRVEDGWYSPSYGVRVPAPVVRGRRRGTGPTELRLRATRD